MNDNGLIVYNNIIYGKSFAVLREVFQLLSNTPGQDFEKIFAKHYIKKNANSTLTVPIFVEGLKEAI